MRAIILAAGRGSRMASLTEKLPKCRTIFNGKELIQWQLDALHKAGIEEIAVVCGYLKETFNYDLKYFCNTRWESTNIVRSLIAAEEWLGDESCIISYSDIIYSCDAVNRLIQCQGDICLTYDPEWRKLWSLRFEDPLIDAETFKIQNNLLQDIGGDPLDLDEIQGQYMGLFKFTKLGWLNVFKFLKSMNQSFVDTLDMTALFKLLIENNFKINVIPIADEWYEFDAISDLIKYNNINE